MKELSKVEFYIEDSKLARAKRTLASIGALDVTDVQVVNAAAKGGKVKGVVQNGTLPTSVAETLKKHKVTGVDSDGLREIIKQLGFSESSLHHVVKNLIKLKVLKTVGKGVYNVNTARMK